MGHLVNGKEEAYRALARRLSRLPVGVVINETLMEILKLLYTEAEAAVGSKFPVKPRPLAEIAGLTGMGEKELSGILDMMATKGLVVDIPRKDTTYYLLSPVVVGFFEYSFMRTGVIAGRELAQLFERYFREEGVAREMFGSSTKMFKTLVYESYIPSLVQTEVMNYEKASEVIRNSGGGGLSMCACRHKAIHLGRECRFPAQEICTSLGRPAQWLVRRGFARKASVDELLRNLERSYQLGLVLLGDNVIEEPSYICHCCGCCCGVLGSIREAKVTSVHSSNFIPEVDTASCLSCEECAGSCHIDAITMSGAGEPVIDRELCIGCGVCAAVCASEALQMVQRPERHLPPRNKMAQMTEIAVERNRF